jgi:hypothetical protein
MKRNTFLEQPRRGNTHEVQLTPHKAAGRNVGRIKTSAGRSMWAVAVILLVLSVLATACSKPEKEKLTGTWRWTSTTGGLAGVNYTPESEGFEAEIVFKGSSFTFYKDGKKITSGSYQIKDSDDDFPFWGYTNGVYHTPFSIKLNLAEWQTKKISEATNHAIFIWDWLSADIVRYDDPSKNLKLLFREKHVDGFIYSFERK